MSLNEFLGGKQEQLHLCSVCDPANLKKKLDEEKLKYGPVWNSTNVFGRAFSDCFL
jgi:hypothetical protein